MKIALVTDCTVDLPESITEKCHIYIVPITVIVNGETMEDGGGKNSAIPRIDREKFYQELPSIKEFPTTAAPPPVTFQGIYERLLSEGNERILSVHLSKDLSVTADNAFLAAQQFPGQVYMVDSRQISLGLGFQVLAAIEEIERLSTSQLSPDEVVHSAIQRMESVRERTRLFALVDSLEYLHRGGRVNWVQATLGSMLKMKFVIEVKNGRVLRAGQARTRRAGLERIKEYISAMEPVEYLGVLHSGAEEDVFQLLEEMKPLVSPCSSSQEAFQYEPFITYLTPVIGAHTGPNVIGISAVSCNPG